MAAIPSPCGKLFWGIPGTFTCSIGDLNAIRHGEEARIIPLAALHNGAGGIYQVDGCCLRSPLDRILSRVRRTEGASAYDEDRRDTRDRDALLYKGNSAR